MSKARSFLKYWLLPLIWMALIFSVSGDSNSFRHSSRIIGPLVRWLFPHLSDAAVGVVVLIVRKCAHLTEYAVLALLFWRALRKPQRADPRPWSWTEAKFSVLLVALYATTDELHQLFVPGRQASVVDVLLDTLGALAGMIFLRAIFRWRQRRQERISTQPAKKASP